MVALGTLVTIWGMPDVKDSSRPGEQTSKHDKDSDLGSGDENNDKCF